MLLIASCSNKPYNDIDHITLVNNQGISISNATDIVLPIQSYISLNRDDFIGTEVPLHGEYLSLEMTQLLLDGNYTINDFSLEHPYLLLNKNYEKPIIIQVAVGHETSIVSWNYFWEEEENEVLFDLNVFEDYMETLGVIINLFKVENNVISEYESYFFVFQNFKEDINENEN